MLEKQLEILEDRVFLSHGLSRNQHLEAILNSLDKGDSLGVTVIERILAICVRHLKEDVRHAAFCLNIITKILSGYQVDLPASKLLPSAEAVLTLILTTASLNRAESLQTIGFNTLLAYPEDVLADLATSYSDIFEVFNVYCHLKIPVEIRFQPIYLAHKIMNKLPLDKRSTFVKNGIAVWFSRVVPCAMNCFQTQIVGPTPIALKLLELLEMLTEELDSIDYSSNAQWQTVLENIYSPKEYPEQMKNLLLNGSVLWHRIWIIFIKLLKTQITMNKPGVGSPINSMLPVVEMAFKMDITNRCRAFQCWNVLIDNFSAETNEIFVDKRIKLLIIPLRSSNAKVEKTALAKLETWWHLIKQYETRVDERMLYPFLQFCFGRHFLEKTGLIPGMISPKLKKNCVEVFVEIVGHMNCDGCTSKPRLKRKLITIEKLVDHWSDWLYSLKMAIKISAEDDVGIGKQPVTCAWKSLLMTIAEMQDNNLRRDLFNDVLTIVKQLAQESTSNKKLADIVNNVLISSLLEEDTIKQLLNSVEYQNGPIHMLISILLDSTYAETCKKHHIENILRNLKLITEYLVLECPKLEEKLVEWFNTDVPPNDNTLQLWTALSEALQVSKSRHDCLKHMCNVLLWPLKNLHHFTNVDAAALTWYNTYRVMHLMTSQTASFNVEVNRILTSNENNSPTASFFILCVLLAVIKTKIITRAFEGFNKEIKLLQDVISKYHEYTEYTEFKGVFPILIDTFDLLSTTAANERVIGQHVQDIFLIAKKVLNILIKQLSYGDAIEGVINMKFFKTIELLFKTERSKEYKALLVDELHKFQSLITTIPVSSNLDSILKSIMSVMDIDQSLNTQIKLTYQQTEECKNDVASTENKVCITKELDQSKFTTPAKSAKKNSRKKEANIINTVVENGEEYAVIKSNWKFNPRNLTENQKEKLQRKREDIPALYQDLSQSQDEFKLKSWKTDSQDESTTNSRSASTPSNDNISTIKSMSGTEIVPKIIDNFFSETVEDAVVEKNDNKEINSPKPNTVDQAKSSPTVKTPRMALKDRVFRNVRNLIEKSTVTKERPQKPDLLNQSVNANIFNTPIIKCKETKNINSAPSKISADRPARVKRIPRKFDDTEIYLQKKRRNSAAQNESQAMEITHTSEQVTGLPEKNYDLNKTLKVATVTVENLEVVNSEDCNLKTSITESGLDINAKSVDSGEIKLIVAEVSSSSAVETISKNNEDDTNTNPEKNMEFSCNDTSADKSVEETQLAEQEKESSGKNSTTPSYVTKTKKIKSLENKQQPEQVKETSCEDTSSPNRVTKRKIIKSVEDKQQSEHVEETEVSGENLSLPNHITKRKNTKAVEDKQQPEQVKDTSGENSSTPNITKRKDSNDIKSTTKKKSRIEKELAIDMVEGHPFLKLQSDKRVTRKCLTKTPNSTRRKSLADKLNKSKTDPNSALKSKKETTNTKKVLPKEKPRESTKDQSVTVCETQDISFDATQDLSEDVIESSQDTTTTISVKSFRSCKPSSSAESIDKAVLETQNLIDISTQDMNTTADVVMPNENKDDTELPANKTDIQINATMDLTEEMDTEPTSSGEVIFINDDDPVIDLNTDCNPGPGPDTLELANADTQPTDPSQFVNNTNLIIEPSQEVIPNSKNNDQNQSRIDDSQLPSTADDTTITLNDISQNEGTGASSPSIGDDQRKTDFLNNTSEISPIKSLSPIEPQSPSPEISTDYMVIKLSGPVQPNGEPLEMSNSPEIFTEEKISPEKRDQSPPRPDVTVTNSSPSSSLSLKKNRPQVRSSGRAAHMLGLCVPDRIQNVMHIDRPETEDQKKNSPVNTPARRNLRMLYQSAVDSDSSDGKEENGSFLKFKKALPAADCSPSGPILKRKLADIADEATVSPANKRKRVSFHDPVSTSVSVQKYIETSGIRSPQNTALKRLERQLRHQSPLKSPKKLETLFKLDSILTKAVESFNENDVTSSNDTELSSLEQTPAVEVVKTSELNDTDPIFPDLIDCKDSIDNIASELSSPGMKLLLVKELEGKIETVGDLAKLTELEVNRICIKAPKVQVAKKVLSDYASKKDKMMEVEKAVEPAVNVEPTVNEEATMAVSSVAIQTNVLTSETETQTSLILQRFSSTQTDRELTVHKSSQTIESGKKTTEDIIKSCIRDRKDFVPKLNEELEKLSKLKLAETLPIKDCTDLLLKKMTSSDAKSVLSSIIKRESNLNTNGLSGNKELSFLQNFMCDRYDSKDLILFCSQILQKVYDKGV